MKLADLDLLKLQTAGMSIDPTVQALCAGLTPEFQTVAAGVSLLAIFGQHRQSTRIGPG